MSKSELDYFKQFETTFKMQQLRATRERVEIRLTQYDYNAATRILTNLGAGG